MSNRSPFDVRLYDNIAPGEQLMGYFCLLSDMRDAGGIVSRSRIDEWLVNLVPSRQLRQWCQTSDGWYDFELERCYRIKLDEMRLECDQIAVVARYQILWLVGGVCDFMHRGIAALKWHLEKREAERPYRAGWIIGGYATPVCREIHRLGGLWLSRHKAWTMPDHESAQHVQSLLPGDF